MSAEPRVICWQNNRPLCGCANISAHCQGKKDPNELCQAHDNWYRPPCKEGKCPGPMHPGCCHEPGPDYQEDNE